MESTYQHAFIQIIDFLEDLEKKKDFKYYLETYGITAEGYLEHSINVFYKG